MNNNDSAGMTRAMDQLTQAQHKAAEALYKQAGSTGGPEAGPEAPGATGGTSGAASGAAGSSATEGDVIDAEVVEDEKK